MKFLVHILRRWHLSSLLLIIFHSGLFAQGNVVPTYFLNDPVTNTQLVAFENSRALLIGIDNYKQVEPRLSSVKSVNTLAAFLNKNHGFPLTNISVLTNENATKQNIISALNKLSQTGSADRIIIYFAGRGLTFAGSRGVEDGFLITNDAVVRDYTTANQTSISLTSLKTILAEFRSKHVLILLDCSIGPIPVLKRYTTAAPVKAQTSKNLQGRVQHLIAAGDRSDIIKDKIATETSPFLQAFLSSFEVTYTDKNADGSMSGSEIASAMSIRGVISASGRVVPHSGYMLDEGGDFSFILPNLQRQMRINFDFKPVDALVSIEGKKIPNINVPTVIVNSYGFRKYNISRQGYSPLNGEIFVDGQTDLTLKVELIKIPTRDLLVEINQPDARIFVNGIFKAKVEKKFLLENVQPGLYTIRADLEGYLSDSIQFDVNEVKLYKHTLKLKSKNGWLSVHSNKGVRIDVDGMFVASKDLKLKEVTMGGHKIRLYGLGFPETIKEVFVDMSDTVEITAMLERPTAGGATWRSMIVPGWGQIYGLRPTTGYVIMGSTVGSIGASIWAYSQYNSSNTSYNDYILKYDLEVKKDISIRDTSLLSIYRSSRDSSYNIAKTNFNVSLVTAGLMIACYLYNLSDIFINDPETLYVREEMRALNLLDKKKTNAELKLRPKYDGVEIALSINF